MRLPFFSARADSAAITAEIGLDDPTPAPKRGRSKRAPAEPDLSTTAEKPEKGSRGQGFAREAASVLLMAAALYSALALSSYRADPLRPDLSGANWVGPVGALIGEILVTSVGIAAWLVPCQLFLFGFGLVRDNAPPTSARRLATHLGGDIVVLSVGSALIHVALPLAVAFGAMPLGGYVGEMLGELMRALFSSIGSFIVGLTLIALILVHRASFSFIGLMRQTSDAAHRISEKGVDGAKTLATAWAEARALETDPHDPTIRLDDQPDAIIAALSEEKPGARRVSLPSVSDDIADAPAELVDSLLDVRTPTPHEPVVAEPTPSPQPDVLTPSPILPQAKPAMVAKEPPAKPRQKKEEPEGFKIIDTSSALEVEKVVVVPSKGQVGFRLPDFEFLDPPEGSGVIVEEEQLKQTAALLEKTLSDYGVSGRVEEIHPGPTVTTFEVSPAAGTKVSKVASLADDLALGLSRKVRIIAPIPGKNRVGFEIPNPKRAPVSMRELVEDRRFLEMKAPLPCVMGRDIVGAPYFADLSSMPHVIVAGATGAGKSVGLNVILVSLLYRRTPDDLRLLMIDPKVVELAPYDGIPHMLLPVVTDMKQAATALKWAVDEMERRYMLFAAAGTKNITTYNGFVDKVLRGEAKAPRATGKVSAIAPDGTDIDVAVAKDGSDTDPPKRLPSIVIVIDEFADLMMQQGKDVEASVARLAQKARAAGMHVILATQRPSVDVITGMIKANFPTRVAFRVSQKVDSRTILDEQGAEHLLGRGDMLVKMNGTNDVRRVQCPFISEEETQRVTDFLRLQGKPEYDESILAPRDEDGQADADDAESDPLYDQAVAIVAETRRCSTSWLQRKLGIGYNRAAKLVETMERRGLIGPANGAKDREILISAHT